MQYRYQPNGVLSTYGFLTQHSSITSSNTYQEKTMTTLKQLTNQERIDYIKQESSAQNAKITAELACQPKRSTTNNLKQHKKVLSQAALKRLALERQEAAKTKTEKLAESIQNRNTLLSAHSSVVTNINAIKERNTRQVTARLNKIAKVKEAEPINRDTEFDIFKARIQERDLRHHHILKQAESIRNRLSKLSNRQTTKLQEGLRDCYGIYDFIEDSKDSWEFYELLKSYFKATLAKIQSNTPNEGLLVRFVFEQKTTKQISEYATVIRYAREINIAKKDFIKWYSETTQTRILAMARKQAHTSDEEKLRRARVLLLRYFDIQEEWPLGHFEYPATLAEKKVHLPDDLIFVIARGIRQCDRGSHIAAISALHFIPTIIDVSNDIVNRIARQLVPQLELFEKQIEEMSEQAWAHDMTNYLMERELGVAYKSADRWADRIQASIAEDQSEFEKKRKKVQKLRNETRK